MPRLKAVTAGDKKELDRLEKKIERSQAFELEAACALRDIHVNRLYRVRFNSFHSYCSVKWGIGPNQANSRIRAANVMDVIASSEWSGIVPATLASLEVLARGLAWGRRGVSGDTRAGRAVIFDDETCSEIIGAWSQAVARHPRGPTVADLNRVVSERRPWLVTPVPAGCGATSGRGSGVSIGRSLPLAEAAKRIAAVYSPEQIDALIGELLTISRNSRNPAVKKGDTSAPYAYA